MPFQRFKSSWGQEFQNDITMMKAGTGDARGTGEALKPCMGIRRSSCWAWL